MRTLTEGARLAGRYTLVNRLGAGGMADVWLAKDRQTDGYVALKFLHDSLSSQALYRDLLRKEWQIGSRLMHAHIGRVFEYHDDVDGPYYSMQYIAGPDISVLAARDLGAAMRPIGLIADALRYAHGKNIVHRDLKASNILIDARGAPYLIDFGVANLQGATSGGGSRINASPQQLAGEPARPADDIYALGVLMCELISGAPPAAPPPLDLRAGDGTSLPTPLALLVNHMLNAAADKRPDAEAIAARLDESGFATGPAPANLPGTAPPGDDETIAEAVESIRPIERLKPTAETPAERTDGISPKLVYGSLTGLLVLFLAVIFVLPRAVEKNPEAQSASDATLAAGDEGGLGDADLAAADRAEEAAAADTGLLDEGRAGFNENLGDSPRTPVAELRAATDDVLGDLLSQLERLQFRAIDRWGGQPYLDAINVYNEGDEAYLARNYEVALERYQRTVAMLEPFFDRIDTVFEETLAAAQQAFELGDHLEAVRLYDLAAAITPGNSAAAAGLQRALNLESVISLTDQGFQYEKDLELEAARLAFEKALALDSAWEPATVGLERVLAAIKSLSFEQRMTEGFDALAARDFATARAAFNAAKSLDPTSTQPADGLLQVDQEMRLADIGRLESSAAELAAQEQWETSIGVYEQILKIDGDLQFAKEGLAHANRRAALHKTLQSYIEQPDALSQDATMQRATSILLDVSRMDPLGPRLEDQKNELSRLLKRAATPLPVRLVSDNATNVAIFKVGKFGNFDARDIDLRPGTYVATGSRPGYRDVRLEFRVAPEIEMKPIVIQCEETI